MANEVQVFEMIEGRGGSEVTPVGFLAKQTLSIDGAASSAFSRSTTRVRIFSTTGCVIEFGSAPDGLGVTYPIAAGHQHDFSVVAGQKVIAVTGTATAPAVGATISTAGLATEAKQDTQITAEQASATSLAIVDDWDESDRAKVNTIVGQAGITGGAGAVAANTPRMTLASDDPLVAKLPASLGPKAPGASLSVTPAGLEYETVAAAVTAQAMGGTGATGDYLSHVILQPTATNAGTTTILDNATVIYTYTTGTLADLRPITVPINAFSVSGAWKVTTGASMTATAFGKFTA